ncbi:S8 family serine peptidase [Actinoallomurus iriomotensis]|uniref:S8 family serine peptidase n=1 Tax=Actinoallomurus iriomotensis TaxID=478107 RepID=UPI0025541176|nr:S8 family serine peptidase [Actinoallomurus iriomotensis]
MTDLPPWRRPPRDHFPGVPAWSMPASVVPHERFEVSPLGPVVTREWAWGGADGSGIRVCVLDSGVDTSHPLVGGLEASMDVVTGDDGEAAVVPVEPGDEAGHGTACASVIRAIAPAASLTSVRVLSSGSHGTGAALLMGLRWAIDEGFDVINMSLSTTKPEFRDALRELSDAAYFRRCVIVASAHNMPVRSYPWPFASVISVASHDGPDPMAYYYNPSPPVEFYARGVRVRVAWTGGREMLTTGNSFATPHIAGICALILSKHRSLTPFQLKSVLYLTAENVAGSAATENGGARVD